MSEYLKKYCEYIQNAGNPTLEQFVEDWEPVGEMLRADLYKNNLVVQQEGRLYLTDEGKQLAS